MEEDHAEAIAFEQVCQRVLDDRDLALALIKEAARRLPENLAEISEAVDQHDAPRLQALAHKLKGTAANLSAEPLRTACLALENRGAEANWSGITELYQDFEKAVGEFVAAASDLIEAEK